MADNRVEYGIRPVMTRDGSAIPNPIECVVASAYQGSEAAASIDINIGDPIRQLSTGYVEHSGAGDDVYGLCVGVLPYWNGTQLQPTDRLPGATTWGTVWERRSRILVVPLANLICEIDCNAALSGATAESDYLAVVGENADHIFVPSAPVGNPRLNISTHVATTAQWRIIGVSKTRNNQDFSGAYVKLLVVVNETQQSPYVTAGI